MGQSVGIDVFRADAHEVLQTIVKPDTTTADSQLLPGDVQVHAIYFEIFDHTSTVSLHHSHLLCVFSFTSYRLHTV
jgi:hypothetical protein